MSRMLFFDPRDEFLTWLKLYAEGRPVFDVGCGTGRLVERMWALNIKAMGVDKNADLIEDPNTRRLTLLADAVSCKTLRDHPGLVLFCRPSHTGWVSDALYNLHPDSEAIYISKPGNQHVDLPDFALERVHAPGMVLEYAWQVLRPFPPPDGGYRARYDLAAYDRLAALVDGVPFDHD